MDKLDLPYRSGKNFNNILLKNQDIIKEKLGVDIEIKNKQIHLEGKKQSVEFASDFINHMLTMVEEGEDIEEEDFLDLLSAVPDKDDQKLSSISKESTLYPFNRKKVSARSYNQHLYVKDIKKNDIVFAIGPAGTGKTYLGMAYALSSLSKKKVKRIILTRPVVEAGEKLGFLPGTISQKVNPYLRPLYDALYDLVDPVKANILLEDNTIEIAPLAYMRGRTLNDAFIILDEAQNTTSSQMKMFLTRIGYCSKAVVTGDITQVDLPKNKKSGLVEAQKILKNINKISFIYFNEKDVVRHSLVKKIIKAYEKHEKK